MGEENVLERLATLETQMKDFHEVKQKINVLYDAIMEMKLINANASNSFVSKEEHHELKKEVYEKMDKVDEDVQKKLEKMADGQKKLLWASATAGIGLIGWLVEQLLHISVKIGG